MGISQALYTGVTGLSVNSDGMSVIANNIANANSKGFKYDRAQFDDLLSTDAGDAQIGRGARLSDVKTIFTQGGLAITDNLTDLAIQGEGFFAVSNPHTEIEESGGMFFTRVGSFQFDKDGFLSDSNGGHVQGYMANVEGKLSSKLEDVRIITNNIRPLATSKVLLNVNLDSRTEVSAEPFDITKPEETSDWQNTVNVHDSHGRSHAMTTYFKRIEGSEGPTWKWYATVDSKEVSDGDDGQNVKQIATGTVAFDNKGNLLREETDESSANFNKGAFPNQVIDFDFGQNVGEEEGNGVGVSSSTAAKSGTVFHSQNGYESGNLKSLKFELDGKIRGFYTNGIQRVLGGLAVASFQSENGLLKAGRNQFYKTIDSGPPKIGLPQTGTRGSIYASSLEESNVDLASQFVNMIMTQRGFQANSRTITTTDSMLEEVLSLKR